MYLKQQKLVTRAARPSLTNTLARDLGLWNEYDSLT